MLTRWFVFVLIGLLAYCGFAAPTDPPADTPQTKEPPKFNSAVAAMPRDYDNAWKARNEALNAQAKKGEGDLIFIGDSITQGWEGEGKKVWQQHYAAHKALNLGISGDRTQHVIYRLQSGNIDGIRPKAAVVMIGTNNIGGNNNSPEETAEGVSNILKLLKFKLPNTKVLLLGVFPRDEKPGPQREKITSLNQIISKFDDGKSVFYLDISKKFTDDQGTISAEVMPDFLHLSKKGYEIWAEAIQDKLTALMKKE